MQHFLTLLDLSHEALLHIIHRAIELKKYHHQKRLPKIFEGAVLGMIFEKSSTRTRVSFEVAMAQCGGSAIFLSPRDTQFGRGETIEDTARVLSRMVSVLMIRTFEHKNVELFAKYSKVPVINALTDEHHPCQVLADIQTFVENRGTIHNKIVSWIGDGNNMCNTYIHAAKQFGFTLRIACPEGYMPKIERLKAFSDHIEIAKNPEEAVKEADLVVTDVWASMGQEAEQDLRKKDFSAYQVSPALMDLAKPEALFMHCLPAHRGEEISENMLEDKRSVVWDEAENRIHAQRALLEYLLAQV